MYANDTSQSPPERRRVNKEWWAQSYIDLQGISVEERAIELMKSHWLWLKEWKTIKKVSEYYKVKPEMVLCIARSETKIGQTNKSENNRMNVGNNDRWDVVHYDSIESWLIAWVYTISLWTYQKNKKYLWELYPRHAESQCQDEWYKKIQPQCKYVYASSQENAFNNVANCLGMIYNKWIDERFIYRK